MTSVADEVARVLAALAAAPALLPEGGKVLCVDGPSGAGKTTLAHQVARRIPGSTVVALDDLLDGWDGLPDVARTLVRDVLSPLARGRSGSYRRYDWHSGRFAETVEVRPTPLLVVEGVGAGARVTDPYRSLLVWVDAADQERRRRALARDGEAYAPHWERWALAEATHHRRERTRARADVVLGSRT